MLQVSAVLMIRSPSPVPAATAAKFVTVEKGDTFSAISLRVYGDANKYNKIFEANKPLLMHPDKIYPGQIAAYS